jgi:hypothetical protein
MIKPTDPATEEDYRALFAKNSRVEGFGIDGVTQVSPCPFCAAPDWAKWKIINVREDMQQDNTCSNCGRSAKFLIQERASGVEFELVQTGGDPIPDYLPPVKRVDN